MALNSHLMTRLAGIQKILMAYHGAGAGLPNAVVGTEREALATQFLAKVFPAHRRFTSGAITDAEGQLTGQVDIAIEFGFFPSFPTPSGEPRLMLAEGVAAVIEVKSDLISQWTEVAAKTKDVRKVRRRIEGINGSTPGQQIPCIAVGYKGHSTQKSLMDRLLSTDAESRPDAALVINSGAFASSELRAEGPEGLYALCAYLTQIFEKVGTARMDLFSYVSEDTQRGRHDFDAFFGG